MYLHYIGTGLYPRDKFVNEAHRVGVNRSIPMLFIRTSKIEFGDKILLAQYAPEKKHGCTEGKARVFGYFTVHVLNFSCCEKQDEFMARLRTQLDIVRIDHAGVGVKVSRRCGSYMCGPVLIVNDSLQEILRIAAILANELDIKPKLFLAGPYNALRHDKVISPAAFSRTLLSVDFSPQELKGKRKAEQEIGFLDGYAHKKYRAKGAKA